MESFFAFPGRKRRKTAEWGVFFRERREQKLLALKILTGAFAFILGMSVFSFLNVVAYRLPRKESFVRGSSYCPACRHPLGALDLVPVFSYILLRGKCRHCGAPIPIRDTLMELLGGFLALACLFFLPDGWQMVVTFAFLCVLDATALLDADTMEIPNGCCVAVVLLALGAVFAVPEVSVVARLIGAVCVSVPMLLLALLIPGAFGGGDIKLMAACGLFLGWRVTVISAFFAIVLGGIWGVILLLRKKATRKDHFAFGPFLCLGMAAGVFWGDRVLDFYLQFFKF